MTDLAETVERQILKAGFSNCVEHIVDIPDCCPVCEIERLKERVAELESLSIEPPCYGAIGTCKDSLHDK